MTPQAKRVLKYLQSGYTITGLQALKLFGCMRLASRISEMKKEGLTISKVMVKEGRKHFAQYQLRQKNDSLYHSSHNI